LFVLELIGPESGLGGNINDFWTLSSLFIALHKNK